MFRYALKEKKNDIIWEFFPNVGPPPLLGTPYPKATTLSILVLKSWQLLTNILKKTKIVIIHKFSGRQSRLSIIFYRVPTELFGGN